MTTIKLKNIDLFKIVFYLTRLMIFQFFSKSEFIHSIFPFNGCSKKDSKTPAKCIQQLNVSMSNGFAEYIV